MTTSTRLIATITTLSAASVAYLRFIRPWQLHWGATADEVGRPLPGDEVVSDPTFDATRAITIAARPDQIWPWLLQVGVRRAGWYSYDLLDNLESARAAHRSGVDGGLDPIAVRRVVDLANEGAIDQLDGVADDDEDPPAPILSIPMRRMRQDR